MVSDCCSDQPSYQTGFLKETPGYWNDERWWSGISISFLEHNYAAVRNILMVLDRIIKQINVECCMQLWQLYLSSIFSYAPWSIFLLPFFEHNPATIRNILMVLGRIVTCKNDNSVCRHYAPNFEEVEGAYWFGPVRLSVCPSDRLSVCPSVRLSVTPDVGCKTREPLELGTWNFIYSISTKNKRTRIFFFFGQPLYGKVMPLFRLSHKNLVNTITWEWLELGFSYLAYGLGSMFRWPD